MSRHNVTSLAKFKPIKKLFTFHSLLCCLMYLFFRWFCHFDDDQYVNVPALEEKLRSFDSNQDWYLGKPSIEKPLEIIDRDSPELKVCI